MAASYVGFGFGAIQGGFFPRRTGVGNFDRLTV